MGNILIIVLLTLCFALAIRKIVKNKKGACCGQCNKAGSCTKCQDITKDKIIS